MIIKLSANFKYIKYPQKVLFHDKSFYNSTEHLLMTIKDDKVLEPFLHFENNSIYHPLTDKTLKVNDSLYHSIIALKNKEHLSEKIIEQLYKNQWLIDNRDDLLCRFYLKIVSIEGNSHCNQHCYFCPVSQAPRSFNVMSLQLYENIIEQISYYKQTLQGIFMMNYNEPTIDKWFMERIKILKKYSLPVCINTNATGLNEKYMEEIISLGGLHYLSINLSAIDNLLYKRDRSSLLLDRVLKNLHYLKTRPFAKKMVIAVLGKGDAEHRQEFDKIQALFADSRFEVQSFQIMDRAGNLDVGKFVVKSHKELRGCSNLGSRPLQHLHINSYGEVIMCCEDYYEKYKVGDLTKETLSEVLEGEKMQHLRAMVYGLVKSPENFICKQCIFALTNEV